MKPGDVMGGAALLAALTVGGVVLWRELSNTAEAQRLQLPVPGQQPTPASAAPALAVPVPAGTAPVGAGPGANLADLQRQQNIDMLRRDLSRIWNDMDVLLVQVRAVRAQSAPPEFEAAVINRVWADCKAQ